MLHLKKVCCLLLALACLALTACKSTEVVVENEKYKIYKEKGVCYLSLKNTDETNDDQISGSEIVPSVTFHSLAEMKSDILTGNFTESEWHQINRFVRDVKKVSSKLEVEICDVSSLWAPVYPASLDKYEVLWYFTRYEFYISETYGGVGCTLQSKTQEQYDEGVALFLSWKDHLVLTYSYVEPEDVRVENEIERNATAYYWTVYDGEEIKECIYTIEKDGQVFYVYEEYSLGGGSREPSAETPQQVRVYSEYDGQYYHMRGGGFTERPSIEWLTSFGLVPYVEAETRS